MEVEPVRANLPPANVPRVEPRAEPRVEPSAEPRVEPRAAVGTVIPQSVQSPQVHLSFYCHQIRGGLS